MNLEKAQEDFYKKQTLDNLESIESIEKSEYTVEKWFFILFIFWLIFTYLRITVKYKYMISQMNQAKKNGSKYFTQSPIGPSPFWLGAIYEYPWLAFFEESNKYAGTAIVYSYYSTDIAKIMKSGCVLSDDGKSCNDYLDKLWRQSLICWCKKFCRYNDRQCIQNCDQSQGYQCQVQNIICPIFPKIRSCEKPCKAGPPFNAGLVYTQSIIQYGGQLGFLGHMSFAGEAVKAYQPFALGIGLTVGIGIGIWNAYDAHKKNQEIRKQSQQNCYKD
jgi:hypothetical protein